MTLRPWCLWTATGTSVWTLKPLRAPLLAQVRCCVVFSCPVFTRFGGNFGVQCVVCAFPIVFVLERSVGAEELMWCVCQTLTHTHTSLLAHCLLTARQNGVRQAALCWTL